MHRIVSQKRGEKLGEEIQIREKDFEKQGKSSGLSRILRRSKTISPTLKENSRVMEIMFFFLWLQ
jgi:hypothetical protein